MDIVCKQQLLLPVPPSVHTALQGLLQHLLCLLQAGMIDAKELKGALKQVLNQFSQSEDVCFLGQHGPCSGLPTPLELVRWLLYQCNTSFDASKPGQGHICVQQQDICYSTRSSTSLLLPATDNTDSQAAIQAHRTNHDTVTGANASVNLVDTTAATAALREEHLQVAPSTPKCVANAAARTLKTRRCRIKLAKGRLCKSSRLASRLQDRSLDCCRALETLQSSRGFTPNKHHTAAGASVLPMQAASSPSTTAVELQQALTTGPAAAKDSGIVLVATAANNASAAALPAVITAPVQGNSQALQLSTEYQQLCEVLLPIGSSKSLKTQTAEAPNKSPTAEAADAVPGNSAPAGAVPGGSSTADAATMAAGGSATTATRVDVNMTKPAIALATAPAVPVAAAAFSNASHHPSIAIGAHCVLMRLKRHVAYERADEAALGTSNTASNTRVHNTPTQGPQSNKPTTDATLKQLIAIKKLQLAGFQQELKSKIVSHAPNKQYCHVNLPNAPAGSVWNVAGSGGVESVTVRRDGCRTERLWRLCSGQELCSRKQRGTVLLQQHTATEKLLVESVLEQHKHEAAEYQRRREAAAAARLSALKNASLPEYLDMLKQAKNGRLQQVLQQTDSCLRQLAAKLGVQNLLDQASAVGGADKSPQTDSDGDGADIIVSSSAWSRLASQLPANIQQQPAGLKGGQLREYQMQGVRWLAGLSEKGLNGILADDMGLGKTVQVIAMICHFTEVQQSLEPFLIVCPASVISNWASELAHWAPGLSVVQYKGAAEAREQIYVQQVRKKSFDVLLTTYELLMAPADRGRLSRIKWRGIVVDEGHRLKNAECKLAQELRAYNSRSRLLLTGTPLQNKLSELWSLLNFLMPDVFNSADDFDAWFGAPLQAIRDAQSGCAAESAGSAAEASMLSQEEYLLVTNRLHQVLRPFMMRRLKESVATELPGKIEVVLRCQLSPYQAALYDLVKTKVRNEAAAGTAGCKSSSSSSSSSSAGIKGVNNAVMELRNICNHPLLSKLHPEYGEDLLQDPSSSSSSSLTSSDLRIRLPAVLRLSCKVDLLDQVLVRLAAGGHKVLLFCTMTRLLDILEEYLGWRGFKYLRLDGATGSQERAEAVSRFNTPGSDVFIFMLSLRAGGVGLNLQAADTVIMYDSDWNPQIDLQAQARAHRLGQTRQVLVVRLVAEHTIEEHILQVAEQKRKFADSSITGGFFDGQTSAEARRQYLLQVLDANPAAAAAAAAAGGAVAAAGGLTANKLNMLLARDEQELQLLQSRGCKLAATEQQQQQQKQAQNDSTGCGAEAVGERVLCRVATEAESAEMIAAAREAAAPKPEEDLSEYGRGRKRGAATAAADHVAAAARKRQCKQAAAAAAETDQAVHSAAEAAIPASGEQPPPLSQIHVTKALNATEPPSAAAAAATIAATATMSAIANVLVNTATASGTAATEKDSVTSYAAEAVATAAAISATHAEVRPPPVAAAAAAAVAPAAQSVTDNTTDNKISICSMQQCEALTSAATAASNVLLSSRASSRASASVPSTARPAAAVSAKGNDNLQPVVQAGGLYVHQGSVCDDTKPQPVQLAGCQQQLCSAAAVTVEKAQSPAAATATADALAAITQAWSPTTVAAAAAAATIDSSIHTEAGTNPSIRRRRGRPTKLEAAARLTVDAAAAGTIGSSGSSKATRRTAAAAGAAVSTALVDMGMHSAAATSTAATAGVDLKDEGNRHVVFSAAAAAIASSGGNGGSSSGSSDKCLSETVAVCCGSAQGWYSIVREEILLKQQQQQVVDSKAGSSSSIGQRHEAWVSTSAFIKLGGLSNKHDAKKAITLLLRDGSRGISIGKYTKQYERWEQQQQQQRGTRQKRGSRTVVQSATADAAVKVNGSSKSPADVAAGGTQDPAPAVADATAAGLQPVATRKRGRPTKAEAAARLAAEAAEVCGSSVVTGGRPAKQTAAERCADNKHSDATVKDSLDNVCTAAADGGDHDVNDGRSSKRRSLGHNVTAAAAVADLIADAAALCDTLYAGQEAQLAAEKQQQQPVQLILSSKDSPRCSAVGESVGDVGRLFDLVWDASL